LSNLIGQVIKIQNSNSCWEVYELLNPTIEQSSTSTTINVETIFEECAPCLASGVCRCSTALPDESGTLSYINCDGLLETINNLNPNVISDKLCVISWVIARDPVYYGYCKDNVCPTDALSKIKIKPGYFTPACDSQKYEKISCNSSEVLYKNVIKSRYGISNCCDELDEKWLLKKELIDLQSKIDLNYICTPTKNCCNVSNCGCSSDINSNNSCNS
jgi:hypothetical protein